LKGLSTSRALILLENSAYLSHKNSSNAINRLIDDISNNFGIVIVCLGKNLPSKAVPDYQVHFVNPNDSNIRHFVSEVNKLWVHGLALSRKASDIYEENKFDLIHAHGLTSWIAGMFLKWNYKIPLILSDDNFQSRGNKKVSEEEAIEMDQIKKFCLSYANFVLVEVSVGKSKFGQLGKYIVSTETLIARGEENKVH
jgi:Glycosyl transferase 4-like